MTPLYVLLGLIAIIVVVIYVARRRRRGSGSSKKVDLPLWEEQGSPAQREFEFGEPEDDTTPAVLSPPEEWERPKPGSNDSRR